MSNQSLHFSIEGSFVTKVAREKLYYDNNMDAAMTLLLSCLKTDEISEYERIGIAYKILNGDLTIKGVYPNDDYGVTEETSRNPKQTISKWSQRLTEDKKEQTDRIKMLEDMLICINEQLEPYQKANINRSWKDDYDAEDPIFEDAGFPEQEKDSFSELFSRFGVETSDPVQDFIDRMHSPLPEKEDYGWLTPTGEFHPVTWGEHQKWAYHYLRKHDNYHEICTGNEGDILLEKGWCLLHNPSLGIADVTINPTKRLTKAQKEYLYDYYMKRNQTRRAEKYMKEDD